MMGATAAAGWFLLAPGDYMRLGRSIIGAAASISNIQFWRESGYFDTAVAEKPLPHTWSLGVEEQSTRSSCADLTPVARRAALAPSAHRRDPRDSLQSARRARSGDPVAAFYLPQSRLWELLAGGLSRWARRRRCSQAARTWPGSCWASA